MGAWGYGLFQSDADLEICDEISSEAAKLAKDATLRLLRPKNRAAVVNKLNAGILDQLLIEYETIKWDHGVVYLGALAMQLGARITIEQIATLHKTLKRTPMYDEAKAQMQKGLNQYKGDGKPHDFESLGLHDTGAKAMKEDKVTSKDPKSPLMINVVEDWRKTPQPKPKRGSAGSQPPKRKGSSKENEQINREHVRAPEPTGKDGLKEKGTLQAWLDSLGKGNCL